MATAEEKSNEKKKDALSGSFPLCLTITEPNGRVSSLLFDQKEITLGRSAEMDLHFNSRAYAMVSRRHGRLLIDEDESQVYFVDENSTQGSWIKGRKIKGSVALNQDDGITIGRDGPTVFVSWPRERITGKAGTHLRYHSNVRAPYFPLVFSEGFIDRFKSYRKIGMGGFGEVWRANPSDGSEPVAIKLLHPLLLDPEYLGTHDRDAILRRFRREARVQRLLSEAGVPAMVRVRRWGDDPERDYVYMVMDLVDGKTLDRIIVREQPLEQARIARYLHDVARALQAAHHFEFEDDNGRACRGVIHRDVKPNNILVDSESDSAKLVDFGIAGIMQGGERLTMTRMAIGTRQFLPPESLEGAEMSPAADLWALTVTLYMALSGGRFPFQSESDPTLMNAMKSGAVIPIQGFRPDVKPILRDAIDRGLDPRPSERINSAEEWANIFSEVMNSAS